MWSFYSHLSDAVNRRELDAEQRIDALFEYIQKNRALNNLFADIPNRADLQEKVHLLKTAIENGKMKATIFDDPLATDLLLYMIKTKHIRFETGISVYLYLLVQGQFNGKAHVNQEKSFCRTRPFSTHFLVRNRQLTPYAIEYLAMVKSRLSDFQLEFDITKAEAFLLNSSPGFDQCMIALPKYYMFPNGVFLDRIDSNSAYSFDIDYLLNVAIDATPIFSSPDRRRLNIPPYGLIMHIFQQMQVEPIGMKVILGRIGEKTLSDLHALDQHPISLYSHNVRDNIDYVHSTQCGPLPAFIHDIGHCFWANLLSLEERMFLQQVILPVLRRAAQHIRVEMNKDILDQKNRAMVTLFNLQSNLNDYNLSDISAFQEKEIRLYSYIVNTMRTLDAIYGDGRETLQHHLLAELEPVIDKYKNDTSKSHLYKALEHIYLRYTREREMDNEFNKKFKEGKYY